MREYLGLSTKWLADFLGVGERKIMRWEDEELMIPDSVTGLIDDLYQEASTITQWLTAEYRWRIKKRDGQGVYLLTYRTDGDFSSALQRAGYTGEPFPSRWHRMICARVVDRVPGVVLIYG
jgi:hypothetical protein